MSESITVAETRSGAMTMFSLQDLVAEIANRKIAARKDIDSWDRLYAVAQELAAMPSENEYSVMQRYWSLERVSIHGYRGVLNSNPLELIFDPSPGVTVLHGLNGAGKSSISDAIEMALSGQTSTSSSATAGKAPLWDPIHLGRGSSSATIEVTLCAEGARLYLTCSLNEYGNVSAHVAETEDENGRRSITLGGSWKQALASHQPVFAYAALERRVQLSRDLANYFEGLLALGGSFTTLQETIATRSQDANASYSRWETAKNALMRDFDRIDNERHLNFQNIRPASIIEPKIVDDIDEWINNFDLSEKGISAHSVPNDALASLARAASNALKNIQRFEAKRTESDQQLFVALERLHVEAMSYSVQDDTCPVCGTPDSTWMITLGDTIRQSQEVKILRDKVNGSVQSLHEISATVLSEIVTLGQELPHNDEHYKVSLSGDALINKLQEAVTTGGFTAQTSLLTAAFDLATWLQADATGQFLEWSVAQTDSLKQWKFARARATEYFITVWRQEQKNGSEAPTWASTTKRVDDLRVHLRRKRSAALEGKANERVKELLADAELHLENLTVLATKASMDLLDDNNNQVELGMLSAGQRNAVLLAPLLASVDAGPFGFLVLDDPVHAFDELRIDRLASSITELAANRRVIILTHDERLKEHLAARTEYCDTRLVKRSNVDGSVAVSRTNHFWDQLLSDANSLLDLATSATGSSTEATDTVRALCRLSIDNALRTFVIRNAVKRSRNTQYDLRRIDAVHRTDQRLELAGQFCPDVHDRQNPAILAKELCAPYFPDWNRAIHGNPPETNASKEEIRAARNACKRLEKAE